ncbi:hypothetical protein NEDG_01556 [Nematocida displodere]|uniref:Uncharacterized protein n=1 Tax=Nematocida displodere TaxID=1805483 RepID=A0A177EG85_9MICR|nr:hypothetical protein NEDG_01556 [Nematocida displodere]
MRRAIETLSEKYKSVSLCEEVEVEIERYSDKYQKNSDGSLNILTALISQAEEFPAEIVAGGFGHGVKCAAKGSSSKSVFSVEIGSEVEEESEDTPEEESEDNDYNENYYDDDEGSRDNHSEDAM